MIVIEKLFAYFHLQLLYHSLSSIVTKCVSTKSIFLQLQIDIEIFYRMQSHLTSQTEHQSRLGIVRVSFRDTVNHIHNLNLAPTLIIISTNSEPKNSLT